jgi:hypothetical protein
MTLRGILAAFLAKSQENSLRHVLGQVRIAADLP